MNGPVAQIVSLTAYTNAVLYGKENNSFDLTNSTAKFCKNIKFIDWINGKEEMLAESPSEWAKFLKKSGIKTLWLHYVPSEKPDVKDRYTVGFVGGGGRWLIEAIYGEKSDYWEGRWEVGDREAKDQKIWLVTYGRISRDDIVRKFKPESLSNVSNNLIKCLNDVKDFSEKHDIGNFNECFNKALNCFNTKTPLELVFHKDLLPKVYHNNDSMQILCSCQAAWVFGGMGSWNDLGFDGKEQEIYEKISDNLYKTICNAIPAAINSLIKE